MTENNQRAQPPGQVKIVRALGELLETKDFNSITTAEIARGAGVTEGLIYKYFDNKRDLLYHLLDVYFSRFITRCETATAQADTVLEKLRAVALTYLDSYDRYRVFARILLLEVRTAASFFESRAYVQVRRHSRIVLDLIKKGMAGGEIRNDLPPEAIRDAVFGIIEHSALAGLLFNRPIDAPAVSDQACQMLFDGIRIRKGGG